MPAQYRNVFNGTMMVRKKVVAKQKGKAIMPKEAIVPQESVGTVAKTKTLDQKQLRSRLAAELFKKL